MASVEVPGKNGSNNNIPGKTKLVVLRLEHAENVSLPKNPFLIRKSVEQIAGKIEGGFPDNGGARYTLKVSNPEQVKALLQMDKLTDGTPVIVTEHLDNNVTRCVVKCRELMDLTEEVLLEEVAAQGVIGVRKITRKSEDGLQEETPSIVLSCSGQTAPEYVFFAYLRVKTSPYYPELIQCYKCWQFWHIKPNCSCDPMCGTCSGPHDTVIGKICPTKPYCKKCESDEHPISSRKCPKYVVENTIARIKIDRNISYDAAKKAYEEAKVKSVDVLMQKLADLEMMMKNNDKTVVNSKSVEGLLQKFTDLELIIKEKDREIQVLRGIFNTMQQARKPTGDDQPTVQPKSKSKQEVPSKTVVNPSKAETKQKQNQTLVEDQQFGSTVGDSKTTGKPAGRSGKKKRGKAKK
ncbi:uncharacterized protein LOC135700168 [Ochlerotatus camptorhynchus]|uniref:uncharacterized protein LOC135700168 n=1 Tax=Ochlerotatus camptorhynchus TaxID=644619 RepID=UPI0031D33A26